MTYHHGMIFIETPIFTKRLSELLDDDSYAAFQRMLALLARCWRCHRRHRRHP